MLIFVAKTVKEAQEYILRELDAKHRRQFDIDLGESINVETEPLEEGGLKDLGKAIGKKIGQAGKNVKNKISNAIDFNGDSVHLEFIDFVKVQVGVNSKSGWLGEISTEVFGFYDYNMKK